MLASAKILLPFSHQAGTAHGGQSIHRGRTHNTAVCTGNDIDDTPESIFCDFTVQHEPVSTS